MRNENELSIYKTNLLYFILAIVFLLVGGTAQYLNLFFGILVTEILIIALPSIWFVKKRKLSLKRTFRLNKIGIKNIVLIFVITILMYPIASFFQNLFVNILNSFMPFNPYVLPEEISKIPFLWSIFFIAIVPGICEEIMFRGTILKAYEKLGIKKAIIISAVLFGMFHFSLINLIAPAILGIVFGIMVYKTNSIYSSMLAHALNNSIALILNYFMMKNVDFINEITIQQTEADILQTIISFAIMLIFIIALIKVVKILLNKLTPSSIEYIEEEEVEEIDEYESTTSFFSYTPIIIVTIMFFIFNFMFIFK